MVQLRFIWSYFYDALLLGLLRHLPLVLSLLSLLGICSFDLLGSFGIPLLFWHETLWKQFLAGVCVALSVVFILFDAYLLDTGRPGRRWQEAIPESTRKISFRGKRKRGETNQVQESAPPVSLVEARMYLLGGVLSWLGLALIVGFVHFVLGVGGTSEVDLPWDRRLLLPIGFVIGWAMAAWAIHWIFRLIETLEDAKEPAKTGVLWRSSERVRAVMAPVAGDARPDAVTRSRLRMLSGMVTMILLLVYITIAILVRFSREAVIIPTVGLCLVIMLLCAGYGFVAIRTPWRGATGWRSLGSNAGAMGIVLFLAMGVGGYPQRKIRFEGLDDYYLNPPSRYATESDKIAGLGLVDPDERLVSPAGGDGLLHPIVIVCSSGGGIRAAAWAGAVLGQLDNSLAGFPYRVKVMTGASGGMLGNSYYACTLVPPGQAGASRHSLNGPGGPYAPLSATEMVQRLAADGLSTTVKHMLFADLPLLFWPAERSPGKDRGGAMENRWRVNLGDAFANATFGSTRPGERELWRPSLIFSPMMVEDGRRMLLSNLDLNFMCFSGGHRLGTPADDGPVTPVDGHNHFIYSQSGYEFSKWFPRAFDDFRISTAVRMNASFPYVSPAGVLPTNDRRRVVDAGYYDNYGLTTATTWLIHCIDGDKTPRLEKICSGVVIIQIRDSQSELDGDHPELKGPDEEKSSILSRGWEWLTSPPSAYMAAGDSVSLFRNDLSLEKLSELFDDQGYDGDFFTTVQFDYSGGTLTWYLTQPQTQDILTAADTMSGGKISSDNKRRDENNAQAMSALKAWWMVRDGKRPGQ